MKSRQEIGIKLTRKLSEIYGLVVPKAIAGRTHAYYALPIILELEKLKCDRRTIVEALNSEGLDGISEGYTNLHLLPMYQKKIAYGSQGFPWVKGIAHREIDYSKGICPVAEELHQSSFMSFEVCKFNLSDEEIDLISSAFQKVLRHYSK